VSRASGDPVESGASPQQAKAEEQTTAPAQRIGSRPSLYERAYRRLGPRYLERALFAQHLLLLQVIVIAVSGLSVYVEMSFGEFVRLALLGCALQLIYSLLTARVTRGLVRPIVDWQKGARSEGVTVDAWRAAASLPWETVRRWYTSPLGLALWSFYLVWSLYMTWELELPAYSALLAYGGIVVLILYATALRFLGIEQVVRPVLREIAAALPDRAAPGAPGISFRVRLLAVLPAINVITAVVADAVVRRGEADLGDLATVVLVAVAAAASVSLVLTLMLSRSVSEPIVELREASERLGGGDFSTRVPLLTTDETGDLARAFNEMAAGLAERERIREAFGTYVDREVAEHILSEGTALEGEEVEVTAMFIDVRDFTGFAERVSAPEVVTALNELFEEIVPVIAEYGGHVDKFVGDGLLAVFGAPRRQHDHADQALAAACDIAAQRKARSGDQLEIGIGINTGTVVAGNLGGAGRFDFSVIGDAVNVAARVEATTRETGDTVLVAEPTKAALRRGDWSLEERPQVPLKGKRESVRLYAVALAGDRTTGPKKNS